MKLNIFQPGPLEGLARYISSNLGVRVIMQGCHIHATRDPEPTIVIPNMEGATEEQVDMLTGFVLHEAFHFAYTNFEVLDQIEDYFTFQVNNQLEDEFIERKGEKRYLGARKHLVLTHRKVGEFMTERVKKILKESALQAERGNVSASKRQLNDIPTYILSRLFNGADLPPEEKKKLEERNEIFNLLGVWMLIKRRYDVSAEQLKKYHDHPWSKIIDMATEERARSTRETVLQTKEIIRQCGLAPTEAEKRPIKEFKKKLEEMKEARKKAIEFNKRVRSINRQVREEINSKTNRLSEKREMDALAEERRQASTDLAISRETVREAIIQRKKAAHKRNSIRESYKLTKAAYRQALHDAKTPQDQTRTAITNALIRIRKEEIRTVKVILDRAREEVEMTKENVRKAKEANATKKAIKDEARHLAKEAKTIYNTKATEIKQAVESVHVEELTKQTALRDEQDTISDQAEEVATEIRSEINENDKTVSKLAEEEDVNKLCHDKMQEYKGEAVEELNSNDTGVFNHNRTFDETAVRYLTIPPSRKYVPFTRTYDHVVRVNADDESHKKYLETVIRMAGPIQEAILRLRRIKSPIETRVKFNVEEGRLDTRYLRNIILRSRGIQTDVERIWKRTDPKPKPQVAVQVLLDCSNSMDDKIQHAQNALVVMSEVFRTLKIPFEVIGHTTDEEGRANVPYTDKDIEEWASRVVPFKGYLFKEFNDTFNTESVFSAFDMDDNLDGEAMLWAAQRLCERPERVKLMLAISDGVPNAPCSHYGELQRHLFQVCKSLETYEPQGFVMHGIGIGNDAVGNYFKNHSKIETAEGLTELVINLLEEILTKALGIAA